MATNEPNTKQIAIHQKLLNPIYAKVLRRISERLNKSFTYPFILLNLENKFGTTINYIHFLSFATKLKEFILKSPHPTLVHCHGKDIIWDLKDFETGKAFHNKEYFKDIKELSDKIYFIANSTFTKRQLLKQNIDESRIFINHFGIEIKKERPEIIKNSFKVLYLGRLIDVKGPLETIQAFEMACDKGMNGELIIAGRGVMEKKCRERIENSRYSSQIKMLGWVDKEGAAQLYETCDLFTAHNKMDFYTNQVEAFGVTIIEAMSYGLPVLTGKSGGVVDSIVHEETGFLFEPGDVEAHANYLLQLYLDKELRKKMSENGKKRIINYFSLEKEKQGLKGIIQKISPA